MKRFIGIDIFQDFYATPADLMSEHGRTEFIAKLKSPEGQEKCTYNGFTPEEVNAFIASISTDKQILFHSWIAQNATLIKFLTEGKLNEYDNKSINQHGAYTEFKEFVTPYLVDRLLSISSDDPEDIAKAFSFVQLLDEDHSALVEQHLFRPVDSFLKKKLRQATSVIKEEELLEIAQATTSDTIISIVNRFSRSMYATRLDYVDQQLSLIRMTACSARLANWILRQLAQVKLNGEHQSKLIAFRGDLKSGTLKTKNTLTKKASLNYGKWASAFFLLLIVGAAVWVVRYKPFSDPEPIPQTDRTSFEQFSPDERKRIDSMLQQMQGNRVTDDYADLSSPIYGGSSAILVRNEFPNKQFETIYDDFTKDAAIQVQFPDSCKSSTAFVPLKNTKSFDVRSTALSAMFKNESEYDALVISARPTSNGQVYSALIKSGEIKVLPLEKGDLITLIYGLKYNTFDSPTGVSSDLLPSASFTHHFCETDFNYDNSMNTSYQVVEVLNGKTKFLISGDMHTEVHLLDIYQVLEVW